MEGFSLPVGVEGLPFWYRKWYIGAIGYEETHIGMVKRYD